MILSNRKCFFISKNWFCLERRKKKQWKQNIHKICFSFEKYSGVNNLFAINFQFKTIFFLIYMKIFAWIFVVFFCVISFCEFRLYFDINVIYTNSCVVCQNDPNIDLLYHHQFAMQFASLTERIDIGNPAPLLLHLFNLRAIFLYTF